ncbi:MAG TPA: TonB family protein [Geobacteraceae bacterium]|nr:TonB family protein [Geobacteraceae bacterium]
MNSRLIKKSGISRMVGISLLLHASLFGIAYRFSHLMNPHQTGPQTYYVDVVNLPVANPQSGTPSVSQKSAPPSPSSTQQEIKPPPVAPKKSAAPEPSQTVKKEQPAVKEKETGEQLAERLARLQKKVEGKHLGDALAALSKKADKNGRPGMPGAKGIESGSDYASYIQSRLRDAFNITIAYQSGNPEMVVRLRINRYGKIIGYRVERSSRDKQFEASVTRAIDMAAENFPPPPGGENFEHGYIFRPEGVGKK